MPPRFVIGIDLGTTNSVVAYAPIHSDAERAAIELLPIPQLVAPGTIENRTALPSFLYLATDAEAGQGAFDLPWVQNAAIVAGEFARKQSAENPTRTVAAAKSWLANARVDRRQPILPWDAPPDVPKISPVDASRAYLSHLIGAWHAAFPDDPIQQQRVVLTAPASFDASARELTREAALAAGLPEDFVMLEEPQAAIYAWLAAQGEGWRKRLKLGDTLLVCDVGGGTTDFTLVNVAEEAGELVLKRVAVGAHILVGGDNMDLALAHHAASAFQEKGVALDAWQSVALWHSCRAAKEALFAEGGPATHPVAVLGRGRKLVAGTVSVDLERGATLKLLLDGFFPEVDAAARPARRRASGFRELGLPFEADAAVTRHLAEFLSLHGENGAPARPTHVLFNGGVFKAPTLRERLLNILGGWFNGGTAPANLEGQPDLDHSVARGAAYYALAKDGRGLRIRGGAARSYYVGIETSGLAIPGAPRPLRALCVVPIGMEEGTSIDVPTPAVGLVVGEPATFRFFSSAVRKQDTPGELLNAWTEQELVETDPLEATLPATEQLDDGYAPVRFQSRITELGVFELWCVSTTTDHRWKLEFSVREAE